MQQFEKQNYFVDISGSLKLKQEALAKHKSQFTDAEGIKTMVETWAKDAGKLAGYDYAEGIVRIDLRI